MRSYSAQGRETIVRRRGRKTGGEKDNTRHPLLVYANFGRRYRSPGMLLIILGVLFFIPLFASDLQTDAVQPEALAGVGLVVLLVGMGFWFMAWLALNRAYVQCQPDLLTIRTPFYRTRMSYRRIKTMQPVKVSQVFPRDALKGTGKILMTPLLGMTAVEMHVSSWPTSKNRLRRFMGEFMLSSRADAWLFIVPNYSILLRQLDSAIQNKADERRKVTTGYRDPFERLQDYVEG